MRYLTGASLPPLKITLTEHDDTPTDLAGYTVTIRVGPTGGAATVEKTTGILVTGSTVTVDWTAAELALLTAGVWELDVIATAGDGRARKWSDQLRISRALEAP